LAPDFKTIADFRRDNGPPMLKACQQFVALCRELGVLHASNVAIDASKFKAVNAKTKSFAREKLKRRLGKIEKYLATASRQLSPRNIIRREEIVARGEVSIAATVPNPHASSAAAHGRFYRADFPYIAGDDAYIFQPALD
jgi:hypothetical protein